MEASRFIRSAESATTPVQAIGLLEEAHRTLELIIEVHPSSDMAVKLATGQGIGTVSLAGVQAAIKAATEQCWTSLSLLCVAHLTFEAEMSKDENVSGYGRTEALVAIATAQGQAGQFSAAFETVALIERAAALTDNRRRADYHAAASRTEALLAIAAAQRQAGQDDDAQLLIGKILADAAATDTSIRAAVLGRVASAQAEAGQFDAAIKTAVSLEDAAERTAVLLGVAAIQNKAGNSEVAQTTTHRAAEAARAIQDPSERAQALNNIAAAYVDMEDMERARATIARAVTALQSEGETSRGSVLTAIATTQTKVGHVEAAQQTLAAAFEAALATEDIKWRLGQFFDISAAQAKAGSAEGARATIDNVIEHAKLAKDHTSLWGYLSSAVHLNDTPIPIAPDQVAEIVESVTSLALQDAPGKEDLFYNLGQFLGEIGAASHVMEILKSLDGWRQEGVLGNLVSGQVKAAQFAEAIETARLTEDLEKRFYSLEKIALAQVKAGQVEAARATIGLATEAVRSSWGDPTYRLTVLAEAQLEAGLAGDAKDSLRAALRAAKSRSQWGNPTSDLQSILEVLSEMHDAALL